MRKEDPQSGYEQTAVLGLLDEMRKALIDLSAVRAVWTDPSNDMVLKQARDALSKASEVLK